MKNILSENMLRFGAKNLSESNKKRLTLESIIRTINEYGLVEEVKMALNENLLEKTVAGDLAEIFPAGTKYGSKNLDTNFYIKTPDGKEYDFSLKKGAFYLSQASAVIQEMIKDGVVSYGENAQGTVRWNTDYELTRILGTMLKILNR